MVKKLFGKPKKETKAKIAFNPQQLNFRPQQTYTKAQMMLREVVGNGERTWGTGQNLPKLNRALISGGGLINNGDVDRETGRMFGVK